MATRLILNNSELVISKPNHNANTDTNLRDLLFTSNNGIYFGMYSRGYISGNAFGVASSNPSTYQSSKTYTYTLWFGKWFPGLPSLMVMWESTKYGGLSPGFNEISGPITSSRGYIYTANDYAVITIYKVWQTGTSEPAGPSGLYYMVGQS